MPEESGKCNTLLAVPVGNERHVICYGMECGPRIGRFFNTGMMCCERSKYDSLPKRQL